MPSVDFSGVKRLVSVHRALDLIGWTRVRAEAGWLRGGCPIHQRGREHGDCFAAAVRGWRCHSCGAHGDVIRLWGTVHVLAPYWAAVDLCARASVAVPYLPRRRRIPPRPRTRVEAR
jgi:hypothetical protein